MAGLPVPGVLRHFVQVARHAPVQLAVGLGGIRPVGREVAIAARREMVVNRFAAGLAESIDHVEHAAADAGAKVVDMDPGFVSQFFHGRDVAIDVGCVFEGQVELGDAVEVGPYCVLKNVKVGAGTRIAAFCHFEDAVIGPDGVLGPYARLRPGTELGPEVHIGNFVEVKKSKIAAQSKANHLAYIGDAEIGQRVNVGAGTITCNYDGANKHLTVIEDDVFIGSDTQLVAPVRVGRGATLGAGTTLTKDAPPDALTVSRAKQMTLPGWARPQKVKK